MKYYETELPAGYVETMSIDVNNKKTAWIFNLAAVGTLLVTILVVLSIMLGVAPTKLQEHFVTGRGWYGVLRALFLIVVFVAYIILHELVHGVVYKLLTKQKLTFGITFSAAYCGVPNIYVYRKTAILSMIAPFCVFLPVFLFPLIFLPNYIDKIIFAVLLGGHLGGCVGDIYDTFLYLFKFRDPTTLMRDTGPKQTFYVRKNVTDEALPADTQDASTDIEDVPSADTEDTHPTDTEETISADTEDTPPTDISE